MSEMQHILSKAASDRPWWRGATIYQVYPRSFADSNGDGIGDLPGITAKLDYIASLGVDAVWISPFYASPMKDFGYDVADYRAVDPIFGTLDDFDALVAKAHELGLRVMTDLVFAHTSDQHAWFTESRSSRDSPFADWYVWADAKPDGSPPNNWASVFHGAAWTWDARRGQYYMHNFLKEQPQLNVHKREVQDALLDVVRFWLDRGVDGFRIDAINFAMHDPLLRDNPPAPAGGPRTRPFDFQVKQYNQSHPDIPKFIARMRELTDLYEGRFTVAEVGGPDPDREMKAFTAGDAHFNSAYGFDFLYAEQLTPALVKHALENWPDANGIGWPSWALSNHDAPRWTSRWSPAVARDAYVRMVMLLFVAMRGNIIVWQGEELGLTQVDIPFDKLQDPEAIANWPLTLSRDGARTPIPWVAQDEHGGFSSAEPWLPLGSDNAMRAADRQDDDQGSMLNLTRRLIAFRNANEALIAGELSIIVADESLLVFERQSESQHLVCIFNFGDAALDWSPAQPDRWRVIEAVNDADAWGLPAYGALIAERIA